MEKGLGASETIVKYCSPEIKRKLYVTSSPYTSFHVGGSALWEYPGIMHSAADIGHPEDEGVLPSPINLTPKGAYRNKPQPFHSIRLRLALSRDRQ
jgi:hypothetical protein